jgi:hypothetical protein
MTHGSTRRLQWCVRAPEAWVAIDRRTRTRLKRQQRPMRPLISSVVLCLFLANAASAACVNRFVSRSEGPRQVVTLLTGKLTFQEAQALSVAIQKRDAPPLEWVDANGRSIAKQFGELKVIRPMPVGCDGKPSGVVMIATFPTGIKPSKKMLVKIAADTTVQFDQQDN